MTKEDNRDLKNSAKCWICDDEYIDNDVIVRDHCYIPGKYRGSTHRDFNINLRLNHRIPMEFPNLQNFDSLILLELEKVNLKACVRYFLSNFYFSPNDSPLKTMKNVFYFI